MSEDSGSGLSNEEAREFHKLFVTSFIVFLLIALAAHFFAWQWRPWGGHYATSMLDGVNGAVGFIASSLA